MSTNTENLNLFKYDVEKDAKLTFNIENCLNQNWDKIDDYLGKKGKPNGYAGLDSSGKVPEAQLPESISNMPVFCFNSGLVDEEGNAALLSLEGNILTQHAPCICTTASGKTYRITEDVTLNISNLPEATYNIFYNPVDNTLVALSNKIYIQKSQPDDCVKNDIWVDTSIRPFVSKIKTQNEFLETQLVPNAVMESILGGGQNLM